jgi:hypothetical protein
MPVYVNVRQFSQLPGKLRIVLFLFRVEAKVFEHEYPAFSKSGYHFLDLGADAIGSQGNWKPEQPGKVVGDGL